MVEVVRCESEYTRRKIVPYVHFDPFYWILWTMKYKSSAGICVSVERLFHYMRLVVFSAFLLLLHNINTHTLHSDIISIWQTTSHTGENVSRSSTERQIDFFCACWCCHCRGCCFFHLFCQTKDRLFQSQIKYFSFTLFRNKTAHSRLVLFLMHSKNETGNKWLILFVIFVSFVHSVFNFNQNMKPI